MTLEEKLNKLFKLEDEGDLRQAYFLCKDLYKTNPNDYEVWKQYYFLVWIGIEDMDSEFQEEISIREQLQKLYTEGKEKFSQIADFNFIAGYTISIFPYEYGDYDSLESEGILMLKKAVEMEPKNRIYQMVYLGTINTEGNSDYDDAAKMAATEVQHMFKGSGALNYYFRQVLYRVNK